MKDSLGVVDSITFETKKEDRVIRNGKVAIIFSPGFGAGWYTWNTEYPELLRDPEIVHLVELRERAPIEEAEYYTEKIVNYCEEQYPEGYFGGAEDLCIEWVDIGDKFRINEYDGSETIELLTNSVWMEA